MSRKYRQPGYMDSDRDQERQRWKPQPKKPLTPEERAQLRSLRHATERQAAEVIRCPNCGRNVQAFGDITADTACPHCSAPLHSCRACRHFDTGARWECRLWEKLPERVPDKAAANECALFEARLVLDATGKRAGAAAGAAQDPKALFDSLFKR